MNYQKSLAKLQGAHLQNIASLKDYAGKEGSILKLENVLDDYSIVFSIGSNKLWLRSELIPALSKATYKTYVLSQSLPSGEYSANYKSEMDAEIKHHSVTLFTNERKAMRTSSEGYDEVINISLIEDFGTDYVNVLCFLLAETERINNIPKTK